MPCGLASLGGEPLRRLLHCWVVSACVWLSGAAFAQAADAGCRLQIITSYPESFYRPFVERFSSDHGRACVTNKNTIALMRHMREGRRPVADVVWTSSPVAFAALDADGLLDHWPDLSLDPSHFGGLAVDDASGARFGFALSQIGLMWKPDGETIGPTAEVELLAQDRYRNRIGMTSPARSGTTHLFVETVLQNQGWDEGWALLSRIGSNLATVTARSFGVREGIARNRFELGIGIDFLAKAANETQPPIAFAPLRDSAVFPASVGIARTGAENPLAVDFVAFLRSDTGQNLLLRPAIARIPVNRELWGQVGFEPEQSADAAFDAALAARRLPIVNALFDEMITYRYLELAEIRAGIDRLMAAPEAADDPQLRNLIAEARDRVETVPVASFMSDAAELISQLEGSDLVDLSADGEGTLRDSWSRDFSGRFSRARELIARGDARLAELNSGRAP